MFKQLLLGSLALGLLAAAPAAYAKKDPAATIKLFDPDNDGTVDLAEAKKAATALFDKLETDKDGKITAKELQGRLSKVDLAAAVLEAEHEIGWLREGDELAEDRRDDRDGRRKLSTAVATARCRPWREQEQSGHRHSSSAERTTAVCGHCCLS